MTCSSCAAWDANPLSGLTNANCVECQARTLAGSRLAGLAASGDASPLQQAIGAIWKDDERAGAAHVWHWIKKLKAAKDAATPRKETP